GDAVGTDVADVRLAASQGGGLFLVDVESENVEACFLEEQHQRQADVAKSDHADARGASADALEEEVERGCFGYEHEEYPLYHATKRAIPVSSGVLGRNPTASCNAVTSAMVETTSPGCIGSRSSFALRPRQRSRMAMQSISCTGLLLPMLKMRYGA